MSSELGTGKGDRDQPGHPTAPLWQEPRACCNCSLGHPGSRCHLLLRQATGSCVCPAAQQRPCSRGRVSEGGGHGAWLAPTCNRGALVFVSCSLARAPQMSGVARLFPCPSSSLHGRVQPGLAPSPLGREEGSARARAPPQLWSRPQPGREHSALPGELRTSRALSSGTGPSVAPSHRRGWASQPGVAVVPPGSCCCDDWLPQGGAGPHGHL